MIVPDRRDHGRPIDGHGLNRQVREAFAGFDRRIIHARSHCAERSRSRSCQRVLVDSRASDGVLAAIFVRGSKWRNCRADPRGCSRRLP